MRAIGYVRVSTDKQPDHGVSLEAQAEKIRAMAVVHGRDVTDIIVEAGESAKSLNRPSRHLTPATGFGQGRFCHDWHLGAPGAFRGMNARTARKKRDVDRSCPKAGAFVGPETFLSCDVSAYLWCQKQ